MIEFQPFRAGHLTYLKPQQAQETEHAALVSSGGAEVLANYTALSAWVGLRCIGAAGVIPLRPHKAVAWMLLSDEAAVYMLPIARKIKRVLALVPFKRVELSVNADFETGHRFARLIGAVCETPQPMKYYGAAGQDEMMYAVLKGE